MRIILSHIWIKIKIHNAFWMGKKWPEIEISGRFFGWAKFWPYFGRKKISGQNGRNFWTEIDQKDKICPKFMKILKLSKLLKDQNMAGNRNFCPIF